MIHILGNNMKKKKLLFILVFLLGLSTIALAQNEVTWKFSIEDKGNGEIQLVADATIKRGWHLYDTNIPDGGPYPTSLTIDEIVGATPTEAFHAAGKEAVVSYDKVFEMNIGTFDNSAKFVQAFKITDKKAFKLTGDVRAQACDDKSCTPPLPVDFTFSSSNLPTTVAQVTTESSSVVSAPLAASVTPLAIDTLSAEEQAPVVSGDIDKNLLWKPVIEELKSFGAEGTTANKSLLWIFVMGFLGGLVALVTPCVWPMIPMTISFFLKKNKTNKKKAVSQASMYGLAIIVIYVVLGLAITLIFGASAMNKLATSAFFNLLFFALLVVFAISFFGGFEMVLPSSWTNKMDQKADDTSGLISIFFMAFTLVLVSFSCTGPIIGTLLVEAATTSSILAPTIGMLGFALALAIPFTLFAIFPAWLQNLPKSGGWLNTVKVVLGFLELALAFKFLSVADLAYGWGILDREVFVSIWVVIFALLGLYLIGKLKFPGDSDLKHVSVTRLFLSIISFAFAIYLIPGLWGAPLKSISAFAPPMYTQDFNLYDGSVHAKYLDYESGMTYAKQVGKPVLIDFSGYGCVNCRKMEASVWTDPRVKDMLDNDYILITLMVDDKTKLPEIIEVEENGKITKLKTIGDKWSYLQRHKFGANAQPYYIALDNEGNPISSSYAYDENVDLYLDFLQSGLNNYKK